MKFFKNWPYWVRGAVLFFVVGGVALSLLPSPCVIYSDAIDINSISSERVLSLDTCRKLIIGTLQSYGGWGLGLNIPDFSKLAFLIVLGSFFGWIYGKIKNRR